MRWLADSAFPIGIIIVAGIFASWSVLEARRAEAETTLSRAAVSVPAR